MERDIQRVYESGIPFYAENISAVTLSDIKCNMCSLTNDVKIFYSSNYLLLKNILCD